MSKVFISYGSKNRKVAEGLCTHLEAHGIPCWMAPRDISSGTYAGEITRAIKAADIFVVICSKETRESDHVKNEVNLAVSHTGLIVPYCLDDTPFDDDLEYYLSSKQRIFSQGDLEKDYQRIESIIREHRGEASVAAAASVTPAPQPSRKNSLLLPLLCVAVLLVAAGVFFWWQGRKGQIPEANVLPAVDTLILPTISQEEPVKTEKPSATPSRFAAADNDADTFSGIIINGYPDGSGIYTFKKRRRIDMHDEKERWAEVGDYIDGTWSHGHLNYGGWFSADGNEKEYIVLGDNPDYKLDQQLGKCVKP